MPKYEAVDLPKKYEAVDIDSATPVNPYQHPRGGSGAPYTQTREEKIDTALMAQQRSADSLQRGSADSCSRRSSERLSAPTLAGRGA